MQSGFTLIKVYLIAKALFGEINIVPLNESSRSLILLLIKS